MSGTSAPTTPPPPAPPSSLPTPAPPPGAAPVNRAPPGGAPPRKRTSKVLVIVVAVVVVLAVVLIALYAAGVGPFAPASSPSSGAPPSSGSGETFDQAAATAKGVISSVPGGPWTLAGGSGVAISSSVSINSTELNESEGSAGCHPTLLSGASGIATIPATSASPSSGLADAWIVYFSNPSIALLEVAVFGGVATPILTLSIYGGCSSTVTGISLPSTYVNSPVAAATAASSGGNAFVKLWPDYDLEEILVPSVTDSVDGSTITTPATWEVSYTTCNLGTDNGATLAGQSPFQFSASIYANNGTLYRALNTTTACPSAPHGGGGGGGGGGSKPTLIDACPGQAAYEDNETPTFYNNVTLYCTLSTPLTVSELSVAIENNTTYGAVSTVGFTLEVVNETTSAIQSTYSFASAAWSNPNVAVGASPNYYTYVLITPTSMAGDNLVLTATSSAPATGSLTVYLGNEF